MKNQPTCAVCSKSVWRGEGTFILVDKTLSGILGKRVLVHKGECEEKAKEWKKLRKSGNYLVGGCKCLTGVKCLEKG